MPRRSKAVKRPERGSSALVGPAVNPRSIELALLLCLSKPNWSDDEESRTRLAALESEIETHLAQVDLEKLIAAGCSRDALLRSLGLSCGKPVDLIYDGWFTKRGPESLQGLFGMNGRDFSALKAKLLQAAERIDRINRRFEFGVLLTTRHLDFFQPLPRLLRGYVSLLDLAAKRLAGGAHSYRNFGRAILTLHVKQRTGQFYDKQVSALLDAVFNDVKGYDVVAHRAWRKEHKDLLSCLSPTVPIFPSDSAPQE